MTVVDPTQHATASGIMPNTSEASQGARPGSVVRRARLKANVAVGVDAGGMFHSLAGNHAASSEERISVGHKSTPISLHSPHAHSWEHFPQQGSLGLHHHHDQASVMFFFALGCVGVMLAYQLFTRGGSTVSLAFQRCKRMSNSGTTAKVLAKRNAGRVLHAHSSFALNLSLAEAGVSIIALNSSGRGLEALVEEIHSNMCKLLWVPDPNTRAERLVRLVRILRVLIRHRGSQHDEVHVLRESNRRVTTHPGGKKKQISEAIDRPFTFKMSLDEQDVIQACQNEIQRRLCLPHDLQETHLVFVCNGNQAVISSRVEAGDSKNFPGIHTWYMIDEIELYTKVQESSMLGLGANNSFTSASSDSDSTIERCWSWVPEGELKLYPAKQARSSHGPVPSVAEFKNILGSCEQ